MPRTDLFGDPLPVGAKARLGTLRWRVSGNWLAYAPDGKSILVSTIRQHPDDFNDVADSIRSVDVCTGRARLHWHLPTSRPSAGAAGTVPVRIAAISVASHRVACYAAPFPAAAPPPDGPALELRVYDMKSGRLLWSRSIPRSNVTWSPRGDLLAYFEAMATGSLAFHLLDGATGHEHCLLDAHVESVNGTYSSPCVGFSPSGKYFAAVLDQNRLAVWDTASGKEQRMRRPQKPGFGLPVSLQFAPDRKTLAVQSADQVVVWDIKRGHEIYRLRVTKQDSEESLAISPDGKLLGTATTHGLQLRDLATGNLVRRLSVSPADSFTALTFSPDGKELASLGAVTLRRWDMATGRELGFMGIHVAAVSHMVFSTHGRMLCTLGEDSILGCWRAGTGKRLWQAPGNLAASGQALAVDQDNGAVATLDHQGAALLLTDLQTGHRRRRIALDKRIGFLTLLTFADRGREVWCLQNMLTTPKDSWGRAWSVSTGKALRDLPVPRPPPARLPSYFAVGVSGGDGRLFALARWWPYNSRSEPLPGPDISITDCATGRRLPSFLVPHAANSGITDLWGCFSRDGQSLLLEAESQARNSLGTGCVFLVEVATGKEQARLTLPKSMTGRVSASITGDGRLLALGDNRGTIRLWDTLSNQELAQFEAESAIECLCLSSDGKSLASGLANGTALVWDLSDITRRLHPPAGELSLQELTDLWAELGGEDARRAYRAVSRLTTDPGHAVPFLAERIALAPPPDRQHLHRLIADLDAKRFSVRERASKELAGLGARAEQALRRTLANHPSPEVRRRVTTLIAELERHPFSTEEVRALRALKVLEKCASPEARRVIRGLAKSDRQGWVARQAEAVLSRLEARDRTARSDSANH